MTWQSASKVECGAANFFALGSFRKGKKKRKNKKEICRDAWTVELGAAGYIVHALQNPGVHIGTLSVPGTGNSVAISGLGHLFDIGLCRRDCPNRIVTPYLPSVDGCWCHGLHDLLGHLSIESIREIVARRRKNTLIITNVACLPTRSSTIRGFCSPQATC
jgi:hypothetical protein